MLLFILITSLSAVLPPTCFEVTESVIISVIFAGKVCLSSYLSESLAVGSPNPSEVSLPPSVSALAPAPVPLLRKDSECASELSPVAELTLDIEQDAKESVVNANKSNAKNLFIFKTLPFV